MHSAHATEGHRHWSTWSMACLAYCMLLWRLSIVWKKSDSRAPVSFPCLVYLVVLRETVTTSHGIECNLDHTYSVARSAGG